MAVHPSHGHYQDTLANQLAYYFRKNTQQVEIHSIGRLDLETSGIVLFARHRAAAARLSRQREDGRLQKTYLAICSGIFAERNGTLNGAIAPLPGSLMKMCVSKDGKPAVTHYQVQKQYMDCLLYTSIHDTGAHGFSMGYNYNGKLKSAEVLLTEDGEAKLIRRAETPKDYFATFDCFDFYKKVLE